jgi:hypothetical protein
MTNIAREILFETSSQVFDATTLLSGSQKETIDLFNAYDRAGSVSEKQKVANHICKLLRANIQLEEEIFYPAVKKAFKEKGVMSAVIMENSILKYLVSEIEELEADSTVFDIKIRVLGEHVKSQIIEKQTKLFPKVNSCGKLDVWELGSKLIKRKDELLNA